MIAAVTITHHVVGLALSALLVVWWLVEWRSNRTSGSRRYVGILAALASSATLVWLFAVAKPAASYLFSKNIFPAVQQTASLLIGHEKRRRLYSSGGLASPTWGTFAGFLAIAVLLIGLVFALRRVWRGRHEARIYVVAAIAVAYPISLIPRLAPTGVAISGRSSESSSLASGAHLAYCSQARCGH